MQQNNLKGILFMLLHVLCASCLQIGNRILSQGGDFHKLQVLALSHSFGLGLLVLFIFFQKLLKPGSGMFHCMFIKYHIIRGFSYALSQILLIYAYTHLPFVKVHSMTLFYPIMASVAGVVFLGNKMGSIRWLSTLTGLIGALIIIDPRPGGDFNLYTIFVIIALILWVVFDVMTTKLSDKEKLSTEFFYLFLSDFLFCIIFATGYQLPDFVLVWDCFPIWILMGFIVLIYILTALVAVRHAELVVVAPFYFLTLIFGIAISHYLFQEETSLRVLLGSAMIILSVLIIAYREYKAKVRVEMQNRSRLNIM